MIHENLAICLAQTERLKEATTPWLDAADFYLAYRDIAGAKRCLTALATAGASLDEAQAKRRSQLQAGIDAAVEAQKAGPR